MKALITLCLCGLSIPASAQLKYTNAKYGVSFQYPETYKLSEGTLGKDHPGLGMLGPIPMEFETPGERLATVEVPHDAYPGTDLDNAFFTVSVNPYLTEDECIQFPDNTSEPKKRLTKKIDGILFQGAEDNDAAMMHQYSGVYYHGFSKGYCYELGYGISTAGYGAVDDLKMVDSAKVNSVLDKILGSVKIHPPVKSVAANSPSIDQFALTPSDSDPTKYRISWDVAGAAPEQVWLSVICSYELTLLNVGGAATEKSEFPCYVPGHAGSAKGALDLEFRNLSGQTADEIVRLFVEGKQSISKELTLSLPASPVVFGVESIEGYQHLNHGKQQSPIQINVGQSITIEGAGFHGDESVWIGSTRIPTDHHELLLHIPIAIPTSLQAGESTLLVKNEQGSSNPVSIRLVRTQPQIIDNNGSPKFSGSRITPGQLVHMEVEGYISENTVWIGSTSTIGRISGGRVTNLCHSSGINHVMLPCMDFTVPASLAPGKYPIYFTNEIGKSNVLTVTISADH